MRDVNCVNTVPKSLLGAKLRPHGNGSEPPRIAAKHKLPWRSSMKKVLLSLLALGLLALCAIAYAQGGGQRTYNLLRTITIPASDGGLVGFDISWVDSQAGRYYLANRGTGATPAKPNITVINTEQLTLLDPIPLTTAPNGVVAIHTGDDKQSGASTLVVGGSNSTAIFIDLSHPLNTPDAVSTGGNNRADELAYDPEDHIILIANDRDTPAPFVTFISTEIPRHVLGKIKYDGSMGNPKSTGGIEQPVWNGAKNKFYLAIPSTEANPKGEVDEIDPIAMAITRIFPTTCGPAGLALILGQRLMTSCGDVLQVPTGRVLNTVAGVGADEIWFNPGDERVYFGGGVPTGPPPAVRISVPVVFAANYNLITTLTVGALATATQPAHTTHSVAADSELNRIFVPVSNEGVKVYTHGPDN